MNKEKINDIICESSSDYDILNDAYNYIESLEQQCKKQKEVIDKLEKKIKVVKQYDFDKVGRYELLDILEQENKALKGRIEYLERSCERKDESNIELYSENVDLVIAMGTSAYEFGEGLRNGLLKIIEKMEK